MHSELVLFYHIRERGHKRTLWQFSKTLIISSSVKITNKFLTMMVSTSVDCGTSFRIFPIVNVIRLSGNPSFANNFWARSITPGKSNRTPLTFRFIYIRIVLDSFYLFIFYSKKFSTWIWRLPPTWLVISLMCPSPPPPPPSPSFLFFALVPAFYARSRGNAFTGSLSERLIFSSISSSSSQFLYFQI